MKRCTLASVSVVATFLLSPPAPLFSQALERALYVTVVDPSGAPMPNLGAADFIVREDNVAREVLRVVPATDPMQIAILVDNSAAAAHQVPQIRRALPAFIEILTTPTASGHHNEVAIITLAGRPTILANYSIDPVLLNRAAEPPVAGNLLRRLLPPQRHHRGGGRLQEARGDPPDHRRDRR